MELMNMPEWFYELGYTIIDWLEGFVKLIEIGSEG